MPMKHDGGEASTSQSRSAEYTVAELAEQETIELEAKVLSLMIKFQIPADIDFIGLRLEDFRHYRRAFRILQKWGPPNMLRVREAAENGDQDAQLIFQLCNYAPRGIPDRESSESEIETFAARLRTIRASAAKPEPDASDDAENVQAAERPERARTAEPPPEPKPADPSYSYFADHDDPQARRGYMRNKCKWTDSVASNPDLPGAAVRVAVKLAMKCAFESGGKVMISQGELAASLGITRRGAQKGLDALREAGFITWTGSGGIREGHGIACVYRFVMPEQVRTGVST
jgi:hypothetical protein